MPYKDILVHIDDGPGRDARLELACNLAKAHDAHLSGLYVAPWEELPGYIAAEIGAALIAKYRTLAHARVDEARHALERAAAKAGVAAEWRLAEGRSEDLVCMHARHADLVIAGQMDGAAGGDTGLPERLALDAGRPVLMVPYVGSYAHIGERVLVCWNASREAARAVNDALPILVGAKRVTVLSVDPEGGEATARRWPGADIALHLARHGVKAEAAQTYAPDIDVGNVILSRAADLGADLIVMGAYGQSRLRELVLGGASREIFRSMTAPVLMSH